MIWDQVRFEELYAEPSRNGLNRPTDVRGSGYKMVNMREIFAHSRIGDQEMELVELNEVEKDTSLLRRGDLLFARQSIVAEGAGKCSIVEETPTPTTFESHLIRVRLDLRRADPEFYYQYFLSPFGFRNIQTLVIKVAAAGIRGSELAKLYVPLPPLPEQRRIAEILRVWDEAIALTGRLIDALKHRKQELMQRLLTRRVRFPEFAQLEWQRIRLKQAVYFQEGPGLRKWQYRDSGMPFLNIRCIRNDNHLDLSNVQYIDQDEALGKYSHFLLDPGDFVVSSSGSLGRVAMVGSEDTPLMLNTSVIRFRTLNEDICISDFLFFYLQSQFFYKQILQQSQGSAQANYGPSHLNKVDIFLPSISEQHVIAAMLKSANHEVRLIAAYRDYLKIQKQGLMQRLLTEQIRLVV